LHSWGLNRGEGRGGTGLALQEPTDGDIDVDGEEGS
jgi:hypothetical protein